MKLTMESIKNREDWAGYHIPDYDPAVIADNTRKAPVWLHFGPGNIFRIFPAVLCQRLIEQGKMDRGIICCDSHDDENILKCFRPHDNLTVAVTLNADGSMEKEVVASITESLTMMHDRERVFEIMRSPSLMMVSFTITEKGYSLRDANHRLMPVVEEDMLSGPENCHSFMAQLTAMCIERKRTSGAPLALVSMDNCSHNGEKLQSAVLEIARAWLNQGKITQKEYVYLEEEISFPWSMIDKITPRPHPAVEQMLIRDGLTDISPIETSRHTFAAPFVNAEKPQYLVIEDRFPNGRPPLEKVGVIITDRETVNKVEKMKVCTCLNPLHTCLAIYGCLLGYESISEEMKDPQLKGFVDQMSHREGMPVVINPGVLDPEAFLDEVLTVRLPNPFMPDTPQRIAVDTSQKLSIRFGETIKAYIHSDEHDVSELKLIPLVLAGYLRYLLGVDDEGNAFTCSPDPMLAVLQEKMAGIKLGDEIGEEQLSPILSDEVLFGVNLYDCGLAEMIVGYLNELTAGKGAVRAVLKKYID